MPPGDSRKGASASSKVRTSAASSVFGQSDSSNSVSRSTSKQKLDAHSRVFHILLIFAISSHFRYQESFLSADSSEQSFSLVSGSAPRGIPNAASPRPESSASMTAAKESSKSSIARQISVASSVVAAGTSSSGPSTTGSRRPSFLPPAGANIKPDEAFQLNGSAVGSVQGGLYSRESSAAPRYDDGEPETTVGRKSLTSFERSRRRSSTMPSRTTSTDSNILPDTEKVRRRPSKRPSRTTSTDSNLPVSADTSLSNGLNDVGGRASIAHSRANSTESAKSVDVPNYPRRRSSIHLTRSQVASLNGSLESTTGSPGHELIGHDYIDAIPESRENLSSSTSKPMSNFNSSHNSSTNVRPNTSSSKHMGNSNMTSSHVSSASLRSNVGTPSAKGKKASGSLEPPPSAGGRRRSSTFSISSSSETQTPASSARKRRSSISANTPPTVFTAGVANLYVANSKARSKSKVSSAPVTPRVPVEPVEKQEQLPDAVLSNDNVFTSATRIDEQANEPESIITEESTVEGKENAEAEAVERIPKERIVVHKEYKYKTQKQILDNPPPPDILKYYDISIQHIVNPDIPEEALKIEEDDAVEESNEPIHIPFNDVSYEAEKAVAQAIAATRQVDENSKLASNSKFIPEAFKTMETMIKPSLDKERAEQVPSSEVTKTEKVLPKQLQILQDSLNADERAALILNQLEQSDKAEAEESDEEKSPASVYSYISRSHSRRTSMISRRRQSFVNVERVKPVPEIKMIKYATGKQRQTVLSRNGLAIEINEQVTDSHAHDYRGLLSPSPMDPSAVQFLEV